MTAVLTSFKHDGMTLDPVDEQAALAKAECGCTQLYTLGEFGLAKVDMQSTCLRFPNCGRQDSLGRRMAQSFFDSGMKWGTVRLKEHN